MSKRRLIDANVIIRYFLQDHEEHGRVSAKLFEACDRGEVTIVILPAVVAECVFVLESFYKQSRADIANTLIALLDSPGVEASDRAIHTDALDRYRRTKVHFVDCTLAAAAASEGMAIAAFDADLKKFHDVRIKLD